MNAELLQIHWHDKQAIYSVDFDPIEKNRIVTCGGDKTIRLWSIEEQAGCELKPRAVVHYLDTLECHGSAVNCVRFSPCGCFLASAGDQGMAVVWEEIQKPGEQRPAVSWRPKKTIYVANLADIYDLAWSPDSKHILVGLLDNTAQIWDPFRRELVACLSEPSHFVNGVAWDPLDQFVATLGTDRALRVYQRRARGSRAFYLASTFSKRKPAGETQLKLGYRGESVRSFFRRISFSPDGSMLVSVCGVVASSDEGRNSVFLHTRRLLLKEPELFIGELPKPALCVRFSPVLYKAGDGEDRLFTLPYMMVFAIATEDSVYVYTTDQKAPVCLVSGLHYTSLTDLAWSGDGRTLLATSTDGFVSCVLLGDFFGDPFGEKKQSVVDGLHTRLFQSVCEDSKSSVEASVEEEVINTLAAVSVLNEADIVPDRGAEPGPDGEGPGEETRGDSGGAEEGGAAQRGEGASGCAGEEEGCPGEEAFV
ncbi:MAG: chromatin assembly factor 1 subunit B [Amphiamblys sp. WSBS2006]|nr:MAG: chromatin assembly factor 1 subunit B [Amphiamblys sp. WSBS2006]